MKVGDWVYTPSLGVYGRIKNIWEGEETFYTVEFPWCFIEDKVFEESNLVKLESPYFSKGSIITGLKEAKAYNFTTDKAIMEVIDNENGGRILVKILQHEDRPSRVNSEHWVDSRWFECIKFPSNFVR